MCCGSFLSKSDSWLPRHLKTSRAISGADPHVATRAAGTFWSLWSSTNVGCPCLARRMLQTRTVVQESLPLDVSDDTSSGDRNHRLAACPEEHLPTSQHPTWKSLHYRSSTQSDRQPKSQHFQQGCRCRWPGHTSDALDRFQSIIIWSRLAVMSALYRTLQKDDNLWRAAPNEGTFCQRSRHPHIASQDRSLHGVTGGDEFYAASAFGREALCASQVRMRTS